jgi:pimeloyl-ACP methyl ester carboxylesterase
VDHARVTNDSRGLLRSAGGVAALLLCGCAGGWPGGGSVDAGRGGDAATTPGQDASEPGVADAAGAPLEGRNGFPGDFPELLDRGGFGQGEVIEGFGGDTTIDRAGNRAAIVRRPVVLVHGNGVTVFDERFGMTHLREALLGAGYVDAEIWAGSYLGRNVAVAETPTPHRTNIDDVRDFVDAVLDYLAVERVDLVGHSLGCGMINGYLRGLTPDGSFDTGLHRFDRVGTVVCLGGALYGTGSGFLYEPEFNVDGAWVAATLTLDGVEDATPFGAGSTLAMEGPDTGGTLPKGRPFHAVTALDGGPTRIYWVALWSIGDIVDANLQNAGGLGGADLNQGFDLPATLPGVASPQLARHGQLLRSPEVFEAMLPYLDR